MVLYIINGLLFLFTKICCLFLLIFIHFFDIVCIYDCVLAVSDELYIIIYLCWLCCSPQGSHWEGEYFVLGLLGLAVIRMGRSFLITCTTTLSHFTSCSFTIFKLFLCWLLSFYIWTVFFFSEFSCMILFFSFCSFLMLIVFRLVKLSCTENFLLGMASISSSKIWVSKCNICIVLINVRKINELKKSNRYIIYMMV